MKIIAKLKDRDVIFDSEKVPVMVILNAVDKEKIAQCPPGQVKYGVHPDNMKHDEMIKWMNSKY